MPLLSLSGRELCEAAAFVRPEALAGALPAAGPVALDLDTAADIPALAPHLGRLGVIRIAFPGFADGCGFSLAGGSGSRASGAACAPPAI